MGNKIICGSEKVSRRLQCVHWNDHLDKLVPSGETLMTIAAHGDMKDLADQLLHEGASVNQHNASGNTPLHVAIRARNESVIDILLHHGANVNARDRCGLTPLHLACVIQNTSVVMKLLDAGSKADGIQDGKFYVSTPLMTATENKDVNTAKVLIENGANVNLRDWWQNTALLKAVQTGSVELVSVLLRYGADPNACNRFGGFALHYAVVADQCSITRMLIEAGCAIDSCGSTEKDSTVKYSPLAAAIHRDCLQCFNFLISSGADFDKEDLKHKTPLVYALSNRAWECHRGHFRYIPTCFHHESPPYVDSERLVFAEKLLLLGASIYTAWDRLIWQIRHFFVRPEDQGALLLCIRASGFLNRRDFRVETFYRVIALNRQWKAMWYLTQAGYTPTQEDYSLAVSSNRTNNNQHWNDASTYQDNPEYNPTDWMKELLLRRVRSLENLAVLKVRATLAKNVLYGCSRLIHVPGLLKQLVTLDHSPVHDSRNSQQCHPWDVANPDE